MQSLYSIETYACVTNKDLVSKKEEIKWSNIIKQYKEWLTLIILQKKTNMKEHNSNWLPILDHRYRILIIEGSQSGKTN